MKHTKTIALISSSGCILFFAIVFSLHFLRPDKNRLTCFVSEYAVGNYGWLMTIAFYAIAFAATLLLNGLRLNIKSYKTGTITLGIFCLGILLAGIFPTDVPVFSLTPHGLIHALTALIALISLGISIIAWSFVFKKNEYWKNFATLSNFFGVISLLLLIVHIASPLSLKGLTQSFLLVWDIGWLLLVSMKLHRNAMLPKLQLTGLVSPSIGMRFEQLRMNSTCNAYCKNISPVSIDRKTYAASRCWISNIRSLRF